MIWLENFCKNVVADIPDTFPSLFGNALVCKTFTHFLMASPSVPSQNQDTHLL